ncbi:unnamed protein product [Effrenium voratum]|nr:unnamed protein product [Effrenium voratum]
MPKARAKSRRAAAAPTRGRRERPDPQAVAATKIQARFRGVLGRLLAAQRRQRCEQERQEDLQRQRAEARRAQAQEESRQRLEDQRRELLRAARERRCTAEQMCQGLPCHQVDWEESPGKLLEMLEGKSLGISPLSPIEAWLGVHADRRSARKVYLLLARKWHPDKWAVQGERCVSFATEVAKQLVWAYEQACIHLPNAPAPRGFHAQEDDDENRECYEFASWVGISFNGMEEVWKERRGVRR